MSKPLDLFMSSINDETSEIYKGYGKNISTYLNEVTQTTARYIQAVSDLQLEIIESWRNTIYSIMALQEKNSDESGIKSDLPDLIPKTIMNILKDEINKTQELQNRMLLNSIDVINQNTKSFNDNLKAVDEFLVKILEFFISSKLSPKVDPKKIKKAISEFKETENTKIERQKL
jgi:hypothetical protein